MNQHLDDATLAGDRTMVFGDAWIVLRDRVIERGWVAVSGGLIVEVGSNQSGVISWQRQFSEKKKINESFPKRLSFCYTREDGLLRDYDPVANESQLRE